MKKKKEFIVFGSKQKKEKLSSLFPANILGNPLHPSDLVRNLGMMFDADFSFSAHVHSLCEGCFCQVCEFRRIRRYLTDEYAILVANALVSSRIDYCNSLFRSLSQICKTCNTFITLLPELLQIALNFLESPQY